MRPPISNPAFASVLAALVVTPVLLSGCGGASFQYDAPEWKAGFAWEYEERSSSDASAKGDGFGDFGDVGPGAANGTRRVDVFNSTGKSVEGQPFYAASELRRITPTGTQLLGNTQDTNRAIVFTRNLNPINPSHVDWEQGAVKFGPDALEEGSTSILGPVDPEFRWLDFPLKKGKTWTQQRSLFYEELPSTFVIRATRLESVHTPAGDFQCVKLHGEERPPIDLIRETLRGELEQEGYKLSSFNFKISAVVNYHYCPDVRNIVDMETVIAASISAHGKNPDGERFDYSFAAKAVSKSTLKRFGLTAAPEKPLAFAMEIERGVFLPKPISQIGQLRVELLATQGHLNWADEAATTQLGVWVFNVSANENRLRPNENAFPREVNATDFSPTYDRNVAEIVWLVKGYNGSGPMVELRRSVGDALSLSPEDFPRSGLYQVDAILIERAHGTFPRTEIDRDSVFLEAYYNRTIVGTPRSNGLSVDATFPVERAASTVDVLAMSALPVPAAGMVGCLAFVECMKAKDGAGRDIPNDRGSGGHFRTEFVEKDSNGTWTVSFGPPVPADTISFQVEVRYSPDLVTVAVPKPAPRK